MKSLKLLINIITSFLVLSNVLAIPSESNFDFSIGINPPYFIKMNKEKPEGILVEIINDSFNKANIHYKIIKDLPWKRVTDQDKPKNTIYILYKTPERENKFKWIYPLFNDKINIYWTNNSGDIKKIDELKKQNKEIATLAGGAGESILKTFKLESKVRYCKDDDQCIQLLKKGEIGFWVAHELKANYHIKKLKLEKEINKKMSIYSTQIWLAASMETRDKDCQLLKKAISEFIMTHRFKEILSKYGVK